MISKFKKLVEDPHKKELLKGSAETMSIKIAGMFVSYAFIMYLSRNYGAQSVGIYQISIQFITAMAIISLLGFNQSIIRYSAEMVARKQIDELKKVLKMFGFIGFGVSFLFAVIVYAFAEDIAEKLIKDKQLSFIFETLAIVLPLLTLNLLCVELIRGLKKIKTSEFLRLFSTNFFALILFLTSLWLVDFNNYLPIISYEIAVVLSFFLASYFVFKYLKQQVSSELFVKHKTTSEYILTSFTMYQSILLMMLSSQGLTFILAYYSTPADVGIYNVAFQIAALSLFVFAAITTITAPKYSELYQGDIEVFKRAVRFSSKLVFWTTGTISIMTLVLSNWLMSIFGEEFVLGASILIILSVANFVNAFTGSSGVLLDMVGKQQVRRNIQLLNVTITLILAFVFIPHYGGLGLAYILLINTTISNFLGVYYVYKNLGVNMIYLPFLIK